MKILKRLLRMVGMEDWLLPFPEPTLTKAEAVERVRTYAEANRKRFNEPLEVRQQWGIEGTGDARRRFPVYVVVIGGYRPMPMVEVDALTGEIRAWRSLPR